MKKFIIVVLTILMLFSLFKGTLRENVVEGDSQPIWAMFHYNPQHTGRCPYDTSANNGNLKWVLKIGGSNNSSPAIASDGTIYVGSGDGCLYAISPDGIIKWKYQTGNRIDSSPAIASDGTIYVGSRDGYLYAIKRDGSLMWKFQACSYGMVNSSPVIASDGTIYVGTDTILGDNYLYAIYPNGTVKWKFKVSNIIDSSPAIGIDGSIYFGSNDHFLYALNPDGALKWKFETGWAIWSAPAISSDSTIYISSGDGYLYALNPDGTLKWKFKTGFAIESSPAIASDGTIYVGSRDDYFYAINPDGTLKWRFLTGNDIYSSPAIDSKGIIYVGSSDGYLYAINSDGTLRWKYNTGNGIDSSPAIASDGTIYVGSNGGGLGSYFYAIGYFSYDFSISITPPSQTLTQGSSATYKVILTSLNGFNNAVSLSISSTLPSGVTATFSPNQVTPTNSSILTISTSTSTPANSYTITIMVSGAGITHTSQVILNVTSISPPSPPQNLSASFSNSSISLNWTASQQGTYSIMGYAIYKGTAPGGEYKIATVSSNTTSYVDTNLTLGTSYYYYVKAFDNRNPSNYSPPSSEVSITFKRIPVLLVHGFQITVPFHPEVGWKGMATTLSGNESGVNLKDSSYPHNLWYFKTKDSGHRDVYISDYSDNDNLPTMLSISDYAKNLKREIDYIKNKEACSKVEIVAHSMGGLVARRYVESADFGSGYYESDVNNLVMLGTPNKGVPLAILKSVLDPFGLLNLSLFQCVSEMAPVSTFLTIINSNGINKDVNYYTFAGDGIINCKTNLCRLRNSDNQMDGLVWTYSVRLDDARNNYIVKYADHSGLLTDGNVQNAINSILMGNPPAPSDNVIYTTVNAYTEKHYQIQLKLFQVICPVNVTIKDQSGRMINSQGVNQIPDASVQVLGDKKLFCLPSNLSYTIELDAYSQGAFTLEALDLNNSGIIPATVFENVLINNNTKVISSTIQPNSVDFVLNVDSDGDGAIDYKRTPDLSGEVFTGSSLQTFTVTASASEGGSISPAGTVTVNYGESKSFIITPKTGYNVKDVLIDGSSVGATTSYTFDSINANHAISVIFERTSSKKTTIILQIGNQNMSVNGTSQEIDPGRGTKPIIKNSRTLLPIRAIIEALGGSVEWNDTDKRVTIRLGKSIIKLQIGNAMAYANGSVVPIDSTNPKVVPEIINSRTMIPLRFVAENLGASVNWNGVTQTITITYPEG